MKISVLTILRNVDFEDSLFLDKYNSRIVKIIDSAAVIDEIIPERLLSVFGDQRINNFKKSCLIYTEIDFNKLFPTDIQYQIDLLSESTYDVNCFFDYFMESLWYIKDNAAYVDISYGFFKDGDDKSICSNRRTSTLCQADGKSTKFIVTNKIFKEMISYEKHFELVRSDDLTPRKKENLGAINIFSDPTGLNYSKYNRFDKAERFLFDARSTGFLASKISNYMSIFETLFVTGRDEITKQIKNKVTFFLKQHYGKEVTSKRRLDLAYDVRSKYIHGSLDTNEKEIIEHCKEMDDLVRDVLNIIVKNQKYHKMIKMKDDELNKFFENLES